VDGASDDSHVGGHDTTVQSKAWFHGHTWWAVLPSSTPSSGSWLFRLESNNTWTPVLKVSSMKGKADTKAIGNLTHVLLVASDAQVVTIEYVPELRTYRLWPENPTPVPVFIGETGTLDVDSTGRLWLATDHFNWVYTLTTRLRRSRSIILTETNPATSTPSSRSRITPSASSGNGLHGGGGSESTSTAPTEQLARDELPAPAG
jgi:hypothetical protein